MLVPVANDAHPLRLLQENRIKNNAADEEEVKAIKDIQQRDLKALEERKLRVDSKVEAERVAREQQIAARKKADADEKARVKRETEERLARAKELRIRFENEEEAVTLRDEERRCAFHDP